MPKRSATRIWSQAGVIDPAKVVRSALQNAASIASLLLTTEAVISQIPEDASGTMPAGDMGGMGGLLSTRQPRLVAPMTDQSTACAESFSAAFSATM